MGKIRSLLCKICTEKSNQLIFYSSYLLQEYLGFVLAVNEAVKGKSNSLPGIPITANVQKVIEMLDKLDAMIDETPPIKQPQRFGNQAFRTWYEKLREVVKTLRKKNYF